jgi:hypothetical protein
MITSLIIDELEIKDVDISCRNRILGTFLGICLYRLRIALLYNQRRYIIDDSAFTVMSTSD